VRDFSERQGGRQRLRSTSLFDESNHKTRRDKELPAGLSAR
jgi:hypothetical protein